MERGGSEVVPYASPMARDAMIHQVAPYDLHGVRYYQLVISYADAPDRLQQVRLAHDVIYDAPEAGDRVLVDALLSVVTSVKKLDA
jgi:hypothetical protein